MPYYTNIYSKVGIIPLLLVNTLIADQTVNTTTSSTLTSTGAENITVTSSGSITTTGNNHAIDISTSLGNGYRLENAGTLSVTGAGGLIHGINIENDNNGDIVNTSTGNINTSGTYDFGMYIKGSIGSTGNIANDGNIAATLAGIRVVSGNNGTISNTGTITANNEGFSIENNYGTLENSGTITVTSNGSTGISANTNTGTITNNGTINSGVAGIIANTNTGTVTNNGNITAYLTGMYATNNSNGTITNNGTITSDINGIQVIFNTNSTVINNGTVSGNTYSFRANTSNTSTLTNNGTMIGSINSITSATNFTVTNNNTITLNNQGYIGATDFIQTSSGVLNLGMHVDSSSFTAQTALMEADNITIADSSKININVLNTTNTTLSSWFDKLSKSSTTSGYRDFNSTEGRLMSATTSLDINTSSINLTDDSSLLDFAIEKDGNNLNLLVQKTAKGFSSVVGNGSGEGAAIALDTIYTNGNVNSDIDTFITAWDSSNNKQNGVTSTTPTGAIASVKSSSNNVNAISNLVKSRQSNVQGINSGDVLLSDKNIWIKPYYTKTSQSNEDGIKGFSAYSRGLAIGVDGEMKENKRIGLSVFLTDTSVSTNDIAQTNNMDGYTLLMYGSTPIIDSNTLLTYQIGGGVQTNNSTRSIELTSQTAKAKYNSKMLMAQLALQRKYKLNNSFSYSPTIEFAYRHFRNDAYSESGAGGLNLDVKKFSDNEYILGLGTDIEYIYSPKTKFFGGAILYYNLDNEAQVVSSNYQGGNSISFDTKGIKNSPLTYSTNAGIDQELGNGLSLKADYNIDAKTSGLLSHFVSLKLNWIF